MRFILWIIVRLLARADLPHRIPPGHGRSFPEQGVTVTNEGREDVAFALFADRAVCVQPDVEFRDFRRGSYRPMERVVAG